uniref:RNA-directed DNA polymerase, eukaryota n=1 Tax=Tanacetum cinerariifolium TaxID=118510 RepID=A0A6L2NWE4_TANCI|nr:RNA-directed DNA polymerase, eukaryota [Tanacetum cinerariifolium]
MTLEDALNLFALPKEDASWMVIMGKSVLAYSSIPDASQKLTLPFVEAVTIKLFRLWSGSIAILSKYGCQTVHKHATVRMKLMAPSLDNSFRMRMRSGAEESQFNYLLENVQVINLVPYEDRYFWSLESEGDYSVASIRKLINEKRFQEVGMTCVAGVYSDSPQAEKYDGRSLLCLSTLHFLKFPKNSFEVLKLLDNNVEVLKILENKLESMKILKNKLESLKLQENQPVDGLVPLSIKKFASESVLERLIKSKDNKF